MICRQRHRGTADAALYFYARRQWSNATNEASNMHDVIFSVSALFQTSNYERNRSRLHISLPHESDSYWLTFWDEAVNACATDQSAFNLSLDKSAFCFDETTYAILLCVGEALYIRSVQTLQFVRNIKFSHTAQKSLLRGWMEASDCIASVGSIHSCERLKPYPKFLVTLTLA